MFQNLIQQHPFQQYRLLLLTLAASYTVEPVLSQVYIRSACAAAEAVQEGLRREAFRALLAQRVQFFDARPVSELTTLLCRDLDTIRSCVFSNVSRDRGLRAALEAGGSVVVLGALSWRLGPVLAGVIVATAGAAFLYRKQTKALEAEAAAAQAGMASVVDETLTNIRTVRVFGAEGSELSKFSVCADVCRTAGLKFASAKAALEGMNRMAVHASLMLLYALGGHLVRRGLMPPGTMLTAVGFTFSLVFATQGLLQSSIDVRAAVAGLRRAQRTLSESTPEPTLALDCAVPTGTRTADTNGACTATSKTSSDSTHSTSEPVSLADAATALRGDVVFENVSFAYPSRPDAPVLRDCSLRLTAGATTALVGASGGGKSTIASLVQRLYVPGTGRITAGGVDIQTLPRGAFCAAVAAVPQDPALFSGSVADNISYGLCGATGESAVTAAAAIADADGFVRNLPQGYDTPCGAGGRQLSGGQRQRVALARALVRDPAVLVLDEATSALDAESEAAVQRALGALRGSRTLLVIAHRLSTVRMADAILVIAGGRVAEAGTHEELLARGGAYAALVASQGLQDPTPRQALLRE